MFSEHAWVELKRAIPRLGLLPGALGVVVHVYPDQNTYEVEFLNVDGTTIGIEPLEVGDLQLATGLSHQRGLDNLDIAKGHGKTEAGITAYPLDDGPLSAEYIAALRADALAHMRAGKVTFRKHLFEPPAADRDPSEPIDGGE